MQWQRRDWIGLLVLASGLLSCLLAVQWQQQTPVEPVQIMVVGETETAPAETNSMDVVEKAAACTDLNTATAEDLMGVQGIGEKLARAILAKREALHGFSNRAQLLEIDGIGSKTMEQIMERFVIPHEVETTAETTVTTEESEGNQPLCTDLNAASAEDLMGVQGIGEKLAKAILAQREMLGGFVNRSQLLEIEGIGEKMAERIMAYFVISDEQPLQEEVIAEPLEEMPIATEPPIEETAGYYDLNFVTREELLLIEGINEEKADAILLLREQLGGYRALRELYFIDGLDGAYILQVLGAHLYVEGESE